jgi:hypothetical protein
LSIVMTSCPFLFLASTLTLLQMFSCSMLQNSPCDGGV